jgi:hypothetical protein
MTLCLLQALLVRHQAVQISSESRAQRASIVNDGSAAGAEQGSAAGASNDSLLSGPRSHRACPTLLMPTAYRSSCSYTPDSR